jgi:CHAT domain-containing protein
LAERRQLGDRRDERVTLANIGRVLQAQGRDTLAIVFYKQAVKVSETIRLDLGKLPGDLKAAYTERVLDDRIEIVLVTPYAPPNHHAFNITRTELNNIINDFMQVLRNAGSDPRPLAQQLYNRNWGETGKGR